MSTIPPIDQAFVDEVKQLTEESTEALRLIVALAERTGRVIAHMDELTHDQPNETVDFLRHVTDYDKLMDTGFHLAGQASGAADHNSDLPAPSWYAQLLERRRARW